MNFLKRNWFFIGIAVMIFVAFRFPAVGAFIREYRILKWGIFLAFLTTGLTLETASIFNQLKNVKVLAAAIVSSLFLFPMLAFLSAKVFFSASPDFIIGTCIIAVAPVTIAAGTVLTALARGNVPLSLFICVLCNFLSILTIPFSLKLMLHFGQTIELPILKMLINLAVTVLLPTVIGQVLRPLLKEAIKPYKRALSVFSQCVVLLIILNGMSSSSSRILQVGSAIVFVFLFMIFLHIFIMLMNYAISRLIRLDLPSRAAFTIHTSQKTLTISYLVWAGYFAASFPMALIPPIAYHLTQIIMDVFVAQRFRKAADRISGRVHLESAQA